MKPLCSSAPLASKRWPRRLLGVLGLSALGSWAGLAQAEAAELLVVVNAKNPAKRLSASELRPIFQTTKRRWDNGELVEAVNLPEKSAARQLFDQVVLGFSPDASVRYWIDRKVRGESRPPKKLTTPSAVLAHVSGTLGGIGYVPAEGALPAGVRVVARIIGDQVKSP